MKPKSKRENTVLKVSKSEVSRRTGVSRATVIQYLDQPDAPRPDSRGRYDLGAAAFFIGKNFGRATESDRVVVMRERRMEIELARLEREEATARGEMVPRKVIRPSISAVMNRLTTGLRSVFERELPPKYQGRNMVECAEINAGGVDRVLRTFKEGTDRIAEKSRDAEPVDSVHQS